MRRLQIFTFAGSETAVRRLRVFYRLLPDYSLDIINVVESALVSRFILRLPPRFPLRFSFLKDHYRLGVIIFCTY